MHRDSRRPVHRRHFLKCAAAGTAAGLLGAPVAARAAAQAATPAGGWATLIARARAAMELHADRIADPGRFVVVDFSMPSSAPRMLLVDVARGKRQLLHVAHGRGSDPRHSGWLESFSNVAGSNASSRGAYLTGAHYSGKHGRSQRLVGLEPSNDRAEERAIVIHGAWYSNDEILRRTGKLGRSEGCFAVAQAQIDPLLDWLGPGHLLYADRV